jgi:hypothetical protein
MILTNINAGRVNRSKLIKRLLDSAPQAHSGLNEWLAKGARMTSDLPPNESFDLLAEVVDAKGGNLDVRAIWRAINKIRGTDYNGPSKPKWPEPDLALIEEITLQHIWDVPSALATLESRSEERRLDKLTTAQILRRLFPGDPWIAAGRRQEETGAGRLSELLPIADQFQLIVPSPMLAEYGATQENKRAGRCLSNTGPRRFLITEFDFKPTDKQGNPTIWSPMIELWKSHGITVQDASAAILLHLMPYGPLAIVVYSGSVSLHGWWYCAGEDESEGSRLHGFMQYAASLGADTATYTRSQLVRMPGATRPDGRKQTIHYLNTEEINR